MLVSAKEMLNKAKAGHYAVGQFNINNLEWTKSILLAAEETRSPVILGVSEGAGKYMTGYKTVVGTMVLTKDATNVSKLDSLLSCLMDLTIQSKKMLKKQKNL